MPSEAETQEPETPPTQEDTRPVPDEIDEDGKDLAGKAKYPKVVTLVSCVGSRDGLPSVLVERTYRVQ